MSAEQPARRRNGGRLLAHIAVAIGVAAVAAAAFAISYNAVREIALAAGVPATLARLYPAILDGVFVMACTAALTLREERWWARGYGWLSVLATGGLIAAAAAYHAMSLHLPHKIAAGIVAALPLALVVLGFSLWLSMLRHGRAGRAVAAADRPALAQGAPTQTLAIGAGPTVPAEPVASALPALSAPDRALPAASENAPATEPTSPAAEPGPAPAEPEPAAAAEPEPATAVEPEPATAVEPEPAPAAQPEAAVQPEPEPATPAGPVLAEPASDSLTPPYGFAVVGAPTFLSAPVPEHAEPAPEATAALRKGGDTPTAVALRAPGAAAAARGRPPAAGTDLPAELAHEAAPAAGEADPDPDRTGAGRTGGGEETGSEPGAAAPPVRFERVRSTPTPPGD